MLVILHVSKMPALCSMLSHTNYAQNYARLIGTALCASSQYQALFLQEAGYEARLASVPRPSPLRVIVRVNCAGEGSI